MSTPIEWRRLTELEIEEHLLELVRYKNGKTIATTKRILKVDDGWRVESETEVNKFYKVTKMGTCECVDRTRDKNVCCHMFAVAIMKTSESQNEDSPEN